MSIDNVADITPRVQYTALAAQTAFAYPFPIFVDADLTVDVNGLIMALGTDYTVSGAGDDTGGTVTFLAARTAGQIVTIWRETSIERTTDYATGGPFTAARINDELDRITIVLQELRAGIERSVRFSQASTQPSDELELDPVTYALKFLFINAAGELEPAVSTTVTLNQTLFNGFLGNASFFARTAAEIAAGVVPANLTYPPGDDRRYSSIAQAFLVDQDVYLYSDIAVTTPLTFSQTKRKLIGRGGRLYASGAPMATQNILNVTGNYCVIEGVWIDNPSLLKSQTLGKQQGISLQCNFAAVKDCLVTSCLAGIVCEPTGEFHDFVITGNRVLDCIGAGDGPAAPASAFGEDRGDGIVCWGAHVTITGNVVTCASGQDGRIGIHVESLSTFHPSAGQPLFPDQMATITGNVVAGSFRRSIVSELVSNTTISSNVVQGATWWGICSARTFNCVIKGNAIIYDRASGDQSGAAYSPVYAPLIIYGGAINNVIEGNVIDASSGYTSALIYLQGLNSTAVQTTQNTTSVGTQTQLMSGVNYAVQVGQLVTGAGVPANTYVAGVSGTTLVTTNNIGAGIVLLTFAFEDRGRNNLVKNNTGIANILNNAVGFGSGVVSQFQDYPTISGNKLKQLKRFGIFSNADVEPAICNNTVIGFAPASNGIDIEGAGAGGSIMDNYVEGFSAGVGATFVNRVGGSCIGNVIKSNLFGLDFFGSTGIIATGNRLTSNGTAASNYTGAGNQVRDNTGILLSAGGATGAIATGATVAHGLSATPNVVIVTAQDATPTNVTVSAIGAANFTINYGGGGTHAFSWEAKAPGYYA